jgi:hypothetical protein
MAAEDRHLHCIGVRRLMKGIQTASGRSFRSYRRGDGEKSDQESSQRSLRIAACTGRPRRCGQEAGGGVRAPRPVAIWIWWWSWCGRFQPATEFYHRDTGDTEFSLFLLDVVRYPPGRPSPAPPQHGRGVETGGEGSGGRWRWGWSGVRPPTQPGQISPPGLPASPGTGRGLATVGQRPGGRSV